jgi:hypothetical protein
VESSTEPALRLVLRARRKLTAAFLAEALAAPAAGLLLLAAGLLAVVRWTGRSDLPRGVLEAAALLAALVVAARFARGLPGAAEAALHLDRVLAAGERFTTVIETAATDPVLAEWAARGALARAEGPALGRAMAFRPPAALLPLLLSATLAAGLALLPGAAPAAGSPGAGDGPASVASGGATGPGPRAPGAAPPRTGGAAVPVPAPAAEDPREAVRLLEEKARAAGNDAALRALAAAREALGRGDREAARDALRRAMESLGLDAAAAGGGPAVPGAAGGGAAAGGDGGPPRREETFRPFPVPLRAREAVKAYFGGGR